MAKQEPNFRQRRAIEDIEIRERELLRAIRHHLALSDVGLVAARTIHKAVVNVTAEIMKSTE